MTEYKTIPDADLSAAGDDFHILWTIKKSLDLLNFNDDGLKAITIEGLEENLSDRIDPTGEMFLGIDLTEYYGGKKFEDSRLILISQLKYSTRRANEKFSFAKLCEGKKSGSAKGSIIARFTTIFKPLLKEFGRTEVLKKVKIKLVSNRDFQQSELREVEEIQKFLNSSEKSISFNSVLKLFPDIKPESYVKLQKASGLGQNDFTDFFRLLDFSDCGTSGRRDLKFKLIHAISRTGLISKKEYNSLFQMIWEKMMPNNKGFRTITCVDVLGEFGLSSLDNLFPVTQDFEHNQFVIRRAQLDDIVRQIEENTSFVPICINAGAGMGKSTISRQIKEALPYYSECILFDCYGAGKYQNPEDKRHLHRNALLQLCNQLAKKLGTDFLFVQNESDQFYLKEVIKRFRQAINILKNRNPLASLTLIIDAADNSITAAENFGERSFVVDLLQIEIPEGCNIIVTTRNYRKESLRLPENYIDIVLDAFTLAETEQFLRKRFPDITIDFVEEFHKYTNGIPRVQFYSLNLREQGIDELINYLKPNGKNVEDLIIDKISNAIKRIGRDKKKTVDQFFKLLITLPRPVPLTYLAAIMNVEVDFLRDLSADIWNGLILENNMFSFRDEDFENYIAQKYQLESQIIVETANYFMEKAQEDEYASSSLGYMLFLAGLNKELINIVIERKFLEFPVDPIRKRQVYLNRAKLALKVSKDMNDHLTFFKLLFIGAAESKTDRALSELIISYPDFVTRFGDEISLSKLKISSEEKPWAGAFHLKLAGIYSRQLENREIATKHLNTAREWLSWLMSLPEEKRKKYPIFYLDIAYETETELRLFGVKKAITSLKRWRPKDGRLFVGKYLVENILCYSKVDSIKEWLKYPNFRVDEIVFIVCNLFHNQQKIDFDLSMLSKMLLRILSVRNRIRFTKNFQLQLIEFCYIISRSSVDKNLILDILSRVEVEPLDKVPYLNRKYPDGDHHIDLQTTLLKTALILSLKEQHFSIEMLFPKRFKNIDSIKDYTKKSELEKEKREFSLFHKHAVAIFQLKADICSSRKIDSSYDEKLIAVCNALAGDHEFKYVHGRRSGDMLIFFASNLIDIALLLDTSALHIENVILALNDYLDRLEFRYEILEKIVLIKPLHQIAFKLLSEVDQLITDSELSAKEVTDHYLKCLVLSSKINDSYAQYYFDKAIAATTEIDYEAMMQILSIFYLSEVGIASVNPKLAFEYARFVEYSDLKLRSYDKKHFPYSSALIGIGNIDITSMFSTLCRWHHVDMTTIGVNLVEAIKKALEKESMDHIVGSSLLNLITDYQTKQLESVYETLINGFDRSANPELKNTFLRIILKRFKMEKDMHFVKYIYPQIKTGKFMDRKVLDEYNGYINYIDQLESEKKGDHGTHNFNQKDYLHGIVLDKVDFTSFQDLETKIKSIIHENTESFNNRWVIENLFFDIIADCPPDKYIGFLDALIEVDNALLEFDSFREILEKAITCWSFFPAIRNWKKIKFGDILLSKLEYFDHGNTLRIFAIYEFAKLFSIEKIQLAETMVEILSQKLDMLSDESIYSSFELIKGLLTPEENEELLSWVLGEWNENIKPEIGEGLWREEFATNYKQDEYVGSLLRFLLGHPDKRLRWQAAHSIRTLISLGNIGVLTFLLAHQNEQNCRPFQHSKFVFYWMSAKLHLWICMDRLAVENPRYLLSFKDYCIDELKNSEFPHVLIRYYVKRCCLNLYKYDSTIFSNNEMSFIQSVNEGRQILAADHQSSRFQRREQHNSDKNYYFKFDPIDTLPYWYSSLGDVFNISEYKVAAVADKFITERWGYTADGDVIDFIKDQLSDREYDLTRNDHGDIPLIEDFDIYLEYHAMFCAAGVLLDEFPTIDKSEYGYNTWDEWIKSHANSFDQFWLTDLADPIPPDECLSFNDQEIFDDFWRDTITDSFFDSKIGLDNLEIDRFLTVYRESTKYVKQNKESISITSCLVSERGSNALLRALHETKDSTDYYLPFELTDPSDREITNSYYNEDGFYFNGWLTETGYETDGLDEHDMQSRLGSKSYMQFGPSVHSHFEVKYDDFFKKGYLDGEIISYSENWNDISDDYYRNYSKKLETSGFTLKVSADFIIDFLKKEQKCLLLQCNVHRQLEGEKYIPKAKGHDDRNNVKLYLIKQDGTVRTLRGTNFKIG